MSTSYAAPADDWRNDAACLGLDPEWWFPDATSGGTAVLICSTCEVRNECLEFAIADRADYGVWGGRTAAERERILRRRTRKSQRRVAS